MAVDQGVSPGCDSFLDDGVSLDCGLGVSRHLCPSANIPPLPAPGPTFWRSCCRPNMSSPTTTVIRPFSRPFRNLEWRPKNFVVVMGGELEQVAIDHLKASLVSAAAAFCQGVSSNPPSVKRSCFGCLIHPLPCWLCFGEQCKECCTGLITGGVSSP